MLELTFYIWLMGATLIFAGVALTGKATDRFEPLWLLAMAACWPFIVLFMAFGAMLLALAAAAGIRR